jgi:uncharacterized protein (DUF305 family)
MPLQKPALHRHLPWLGRTPSPPMVTVRTPPLMILATLAVTGLLVVPGGGVAQERPQAPAPTLVQPGAPGEASRRLTADDLTIPERPRHTEADVRFMQNMIHHHEQALIMSRMAPERTTRRDLLTLAARIERAQGDEILLMARWLELRGETVPAITVELDRPLHGHPSHGHVPDHDVAHRAHGHQDAEGHPPEHGHGLMAGMLTPQQLQDLSDARGQAFDQLFLEFMIHHHQGAIQMVDELFQVPGAARDSEIFHFATDVANDQLGEIARMRVMLMGGR